MTKHVNDLIQKNIDVPKEKLIIEYVIENKRLKKENEVLEKEVEQLREYNSYMFDTIALKSQQIEKLEKEITELKSEKGCETCTKFDFVKLTKAKEIIKGLLSCCRNYPQENAEKMEQAEQLLREIDVDNVIQETDKGCPDVLCEECTKEDCTVRKLGLVPTKEIEK